MVFQNLMNEYTYLSRIFSAEILSFISPFCFKQLPCIHVYMCITTISPFCDQQAYKASNTMQETSLPLFNFSKDFMSFVSLNVQALNE